MSTFFQLLDALHERNLGVERPAVERAPAEGPQTPQSALLLNPVLHRADRKCDVMPKPQAANDDRPTPPLARIS